MTSLDQQFYAALAAGIPEGVVRAAVAVRVALDSLHRELRALTADPTQRRVARESLRQAATEVREACAVVGVHAPSYGPSPDGLPSTLTGNVHLAEGGRP